MAMNSILYGENNLAQSLYYGGHMNSSRVSRDEETGYV